MQPGPSAPTPPVGVLLKCCAVSQELGQPCVRCPLTTLQARFKADWAAPVSCVAACLRSCCLMGASSSMTSRQQKVMGTTPQLCFFFCSLLVHLDRTCNCQCPGCVLCERLLSCHLLVQQSLRQKDMVSFFLRVRAAINSMQLQTCRVALQQDGGFVLCTDYGAVQVSTRRLSFMSKKTTKKTEQARGAEPP